MGEACGQIKRRENGLGGAVLLLKKISWGGVRWQSERWRKKEDKERMEDKVELKQSGPGNAV